MNKKGAICFIILVVILIAFHILSLAGILPNRSGNILGFIASIILLAAAIIRVIQAFTSDKN